MHKWLFLFLLYGCAGDKQFYNELIIYKGDNEVERIKFIGDLNIKESVIVFTNDNCEYEQIVGDFKIILN